MRPIASSAPIAERARSMRRRRSSSLMDATYASASRCLDLDALRRDPSHSAIAARAGPFLEKPMDPP
jgi:hypothetical protein